MDKNTTPHWRTDADNFQHNNWKEHEDFGREGLDEDADNNLIPSRRTWVSQTTTEATMSDENSQTNKSNLFNDNKPDMLEKNSSSSSAAFSSDGKAKDSGNKTFTPQKSTSTQTKFVTDPQAKNLSALHKSTSPTGWDDGLDDGDPHYNDSPKFGATSGAGSREYSGSSEGFSLTGYSGREKPRNEKEGKK